ncbi:MAG: DNA repair protein RecO [Pyrinomonadaceae bacterium]
MPIVETESLVLRSYDLAEADRIVVFFTRDHGIVRGVAKGARRLKSRFGGSLELFSTVHLSYFQKEDRELVSVQKAEMITSRFAQASRPQYLKTFSYLVELLVELLPPNDPNEKMYRMAAACLELSPDSGDEIAAIELYFEVWLLRLGGYLPSWASCGGCSRPLSENEPAALSPDLHLICEACTKGRHRDLVSPDQRSVLAAVGRLPPSEFVVFAAEHNPDVSELSAKMRQMAASIIGRVSRVKQVST